MLVRTHEWTLGVLGTWFHLRCGPKDQPSLWHLVLRASGLDDVAFDVLRSYQDDRCVDGAGVLTKNDCACVASGKVGPKDATCGYYRAWKTANAAFKTQVFRPADVSETPDLYEVHRPLLITGGKVAYLPNAGTTHAPLLCGDAPLLRHVKFLRKGQRDLPPECGPEPHGLGFKGDR